MLENEFPFSTGLVTGSPGDSEQGGALLGLGKTLYFCTPRNDKLLGYWDTVADRLFKIRHCMNIEGVVRRSPLFEPPIDPGLLVRAAAAGVDLGSVLNDIDTPDAALSLQVMLQKRSELVPGSEVLRGRLAARAGKERRRRTGPPTVRATRYALLKRSRSQAEAGRTRPSDTLEGLNKYQDVVTARQQYYLRQAVAESIRNGII